MGPGPRAGSSACARLCAPSGHRAGRAASPGTADGGAGGRESWSSFPRAHRGLRSKWGRQRRVLSSRRVTHSGTGRRGLRVAREWPGPPQLGNALPPGPREWKRRCPRTAPRRPCFSALRNTVRWAPVTKPPPSPHPASPPSRPLSASPMGHSHCGAHGWPVCVRVPPASPLETAGRRVSLC